MEGCRSFAVQDGLVLRVYLKAHLGSQQQDHTLLRPRLPTLACWSVSVASARGSFRGIRV